MNSGLPTKDHSTEQPIVLAMTGASGAVYAVRLLQQLLLADREIHVVYSPSFATVLYQELKIQLFPEKESILDASSKPSSVKLLEPLLDYFWPGQESRWDQRPVLDQSVTEKAIFLHDYRNYMTPIASGSFLTSGMVICPCSGATFSGVVHAAGNNLIQRAADVHLKEHRKLI